MAFDVSVVADIFKFPWPLFPKYKNPFPIGARYDIPPLTQDITYSLTLPPNNDYELQGFVFSSTGYKDGDAFSLKVNGAYVFYNIYTKELGQAMEIRPIKKMKPGDEIDFIFHNNTGTSKTIWIDYMLTSRLPVTTV